MHNHINNFYLEFNDYIDYNKKLEIKEKYNFLYNTIKHKFLKTKKERKFKKHYKHLNKFISKYNKEFINKNINQKIFDNIYNHKLDKNQRIAILTDELNSLVIAAAGSGKSLTIIGKIKYLILVKKIESKNILCISFTNDSCNSLKRKLNNIEVLTFHKLALKILSKKKYNVSKIKLDYIVDEYFNSIIYNNEVMIRKVFKILEIKYNINNYKYLLKTNKYIILKNIIISFINIFKTNNYSLNKILEIKKQNNKEILSIIIDIYFLYEQELKSINAIDFNDMINLATKEILDDKVKLNYQYIIIDEYQDTSYTRYRLIKAIIDKTKAKLMAVGDDWQSIYQFTGCNLDIFLNFDKYYGYTKKLYITNTYRNSQELIIVATKFILKNRNQLQKKIKSDKHDPKPIKIIYEKENIIEYLINYITKKGVNNILILGRNNQDIIRYLTKNLSMIGDQILYNKNDKINIRYLTVHKSKGLEEDCTIIINLTNSMLGFPNKIKNPEIIELLNNNKIDTIEEERRLFYVAITRTKNDVYLVIPYKNKSEFVEEIIKENAKYIEYIY